MGLCAQGKKPHPSWDGESIQKARPRSHRPPAPFRPPQPYLAPSPCPVQPPPAAAPPRPARGAASSRSPRRGGPTLRDRQGRVSDPGGQPLLSRGTAEKQCEVPRSPRGWVRMDGRQSTGCPGRNGRGRGEWGTPCLGARNPTPRASSSLVRALGEVNWGRGSAEDPREGESVPGAGGPEWCGGEGRGRRSYRR